MSGQGTLDLGENIRSVAGTLVETNIPRVIDMIRGISTNVKNVEDFKELERWRCN